jgi:hypothetical protein
MSTLYVNDNKDMGIEIAFQNATVRGWTFDGKRLTCRAGKMVMVLSDEKTNELAALLDLYEAPQIITKLGQFITEEERGLDWEFRGVQDDVSGIYTRVASPGTGWHELSMTIEQSDVASFTS